MGRSREAISTIKGYYYQFDYYILQLLQLHNNKDSVRIEGVEDVDILTSTEVKAVQCKYFEGTKCAPSIVGKAIRPMLRHFSMNKDAKYNYSLYGHYCTGVDSIQIPLTVKYIKDKFFTYNENRKKHELHKELKLSDFDLASFLNRLELHLTAVTYEAQIEKIIACLQAEFRCNEFDARYFYYNNAIAFVKKIAVKKSMASRTITKELFCKAIETRKDLFDKWYIEYIGYEKFYKAIRKQWFSSLNISPYHRFFLIECDSVISDMEIATVIMRISEKWSKLSLREKIPFCPYVYLHGLSKIRLAGVKHILLENDFHIWDGYEFKDAVFAPSSLTRKVGYHMGVKVKMINQINQIQAVLKACSGFKRLYQFYLKKPFYTVKNYDHQDFQIQNTNDLLKIV